MKAETDEGGLSPSSAIRSGCRGGRTSCTGISGRSGCRNRTTEGGIGREEAIEEAEEERKKRAKDGDKDMLDVSRFSPYEDLSADEKEMQGMAPVTANQ